MWTKQRRRSNTGRFIVPLLSTMVMTYFAYHIYHGKYGLHANEGVNHQISLLEKERDRLEKERKSWAGRIKLLKDGSIEKDMLDEYARHNLNVAKPNELILLNNR